VYEDEVLLAINKASGVAVHGGSGIDFGVIEQLRAARPDAKFLELVHRLDRDTSGVLLIAKRRSALVALQAQLREKSSQGQQKTKLDEATDGMRKHYAALVVGAVRDDVRRVRLPLAKMTLDDGSQRVRVVEANHPDALSAQSIVRLQERIACAAIDVQGGAVSLVDVEILTGRTHQIRVHLAAIDHPIVGDEKYGLFPVNRALARLGLKRMFLHASELEFEHPITFRKLNIRAALDGNLVAFINRLRESTGG
jgi:23S rRNA pseudouridine955/2504/2580 synthase